LPDQGNQLIEIITRRSGPRLERLEVLHEGDVLIRMIGSLDPLQLTAHMLYERHSQQAFAYTCGHVNALVLQLPSVHIAAEGAVRPLQTFRRLAACQAFDIAGNFSVRAAACPAQPLPPPLLPCLPAKIPEIPAQKPLMIEHRSRSCRGVRHRLAAAAVIP
jgi:hypothetical protein